MPRQLNDRKFELTGEEIHSIFTRLGTLEQDNASISTDVKNLTLSIQSLTSEVRSIKDHARTNWGTLAAWATVIIAIMVYHSGMTIKPLQSALDTHASWKAHPMMLESHARTEERAKNFTEEINRIDTNLQREIHLNIGNINRRIDGIQKEIDLLEKHADLAGHPHVQTERISQIEKRMENILMNRFTDKEGDYLKLRIDDLKS